MDKQAPRVDSRKWTDGGYPLNTIEISRSAGVVLFAALASIIFAGLLLFGLLTGQMAVPWSSPASFASLDNLATFVASAATWLALIVSSLWAMRWAHKRLRRDWRRALQIRALQDPKH
jgi:hypothetical protein